MDPRLNLMRESNEFGLILFLPTNNICLERVGGIRSRQAGLSEDSDNTL